MIPLLSAPPFVPKTTADHECAKYERAWGLPEYHGYSPGKHWVEVFGEIADPKPGETLIDLGCGAGEATKGLAALGLDIAQIDLADFRAVRLTEPAPVRPAIPFRAAPLWSGWSFPGRFARADYGYCCDVMEHIPPEYVMLTLERIRANCQRVFFSIAHLPDRCGHMVGEPLHLTLQPFEWWRDRLAEMGEVVHARDMMGESLFYVRCK